MLQGACALPCGAAAFFFFKRPSSSLRAAMATPSPSSHLLPNNLPPTILPIGTSKNSALQIPSNNAATLQIAHNSPAPSLSPKLLTLVIVNQDGQVLLGLKKRGFGEGYYNGFGGKVESGETIEQAAIRELQEEAGITTEKINKQGILTFHFDDKPQPWEVHVFNVSHFEGKPYETEEMSPRWFSHSDIPFEKMWKDDELWYPHFLAGQLFRGEFYFCDTFHLVSHNLNIVQAL